MVTIAPYFYAYNVIFDAPISSGAKLVYVYLCKCADREGICFPSHKNIGVACGAGVTTVKKSLSELEAAGLVKVQGQARPDKGRRANLYMITKEAVNGFFSAYTVVFTEKLTAKARLVYLYLCRLASEENTAYPAHKTTAKACGLSVAGVRLAITFLERLYDELLSMLYDSLYLRKEPRENFVKFRPCWKHGEAIYNGVDFQ